MKPTHDQTAPARFPFLQGVLPITAARVPAEIIAGITLAAIAIPEVMGYTKIAGTPMITGLYTMLIGVPIRRRRPSSPPGSWALPPSARRNTWRWPACWR